jgi:hypothetical protein
VFQKLEFQHSQHLNIEADAVKHRVDADEFKVQDAGAVENQFLKHIRYINLGFNKRFFLTIIAP